MANAIVNIYAAKTRLSRLVDQAAAGEEIIIARGDKPVAVLKNYTSEDMARRRRAAFGCMAGRYPPVPDSVFFDPMSEEELALWYGDNDELLK